MDLNSAAIVDVRRLMTRERGDLLELLRSLDGDEWSRLSAAPGWTVKDLALHLLDDDLGRLSRDRDGDTSSLLSVHDHPSLVDALAKKNQRWIDGTQGLSRRLIIDLLEWSGHQLDSFCASLDLLADGHVSWASDGPVPVWFDLARELTERWVHQMQIREAVDRVADFANRFLPTVLRTFIWALPHQYRVDAPAGTTVEVEIAELGTWVLLSDGSARWVLEEGTGGPSDARARFSSDAAWRWFSGMLFPPEAMQVQGPAHLWQPLLNVRGIIA